MKPLDVLLVAACLAVVGCGLVFARSRTGRCLLINSRYRDFLLRQGLTTPGDFQALCGVIICGHPDRHVVQLTLGSGLDSMPAILKREHRVPWRDRLQLAWSGLGWISKSIHEACTLRALEKAGVGCPEWIAAGEDGRGAFLLMRRLEGAVELRIFLRDHLGNSPGERRRFARQLGEALAQMHDVGFDHPDLNASHIFVQPKNWRISIIDWQRSRHRKLFGWPRRSHDLSVLHATLSDELANQRERLICLGTYLRATVPVRIPRPFFATALKQIQEQAQRLRRYRHIREIRQPPLETGKQNLMWLDGEALCVTREFRAELPVNAAAWLDAIVYGERAAQPLSRTELATPAGHRALLIRRRSSMPWAWLRPRLRGRRLASPELEQTGLLFRLNRYGIATPRLLAVGQRALRFPWQMASFLLTEGPLGAASFEQWLRSHPRGALHQRRQLIREGAKTLRQIHDADCTLADRAIGDCPFQIQLDHDQPTRVVISDLAVLQRTRESGAVIVLRDLAWLRASCASLLLGRTDELRFLLAYLDLPRLTAGAKRIARLMPVLKEAA